MSDKRPDIFESGVNLERVIELLTQGEIELLGRVLGAPFIAMVRWRTRNPGGVLRPVPSNCGFDAGRYVGARWRHTS